MTEQSGLGEMKANSPQQAASRPSRAEIEVFRKNVQLIEKVLEVLADAELTPDLLDRNTVEVDVTDLSLEHNEVESETLAAYLYSIALMCRNMVQSVAAAGWKMKNAELLLQTFEKLADVWSTYKQVLNCRDDASWGGDPSPDQVWAALERPRRRYIVALDAYRVQLLVVLKYLDQATDFRGHA